MMKGVRDLLWISVMITPIRNGEKQTVYIHLLYATCALFRIENFV